MATRNLHIIMGQSNAVGFASKNDLTDVRYDVSDPSVQQWTRLGGVSSNGWSTLTIPQNSFSVEAAVSQRRKQAGETNPLIFRAGNGGTNLAVSWRPRVSSSLFHDSFMELWRAYDNARRVTFPSDDIVISSFIWIQGESDTFDPNHAAAYGDNLAVLFEDIRSELGPVPIFVPTLHPTFTGQGPSPQGQIDFVRSQQVAVASNFNRAYSITTDQPNISLTDGSHYSANSYMALGDDIADAMAVDGLSFVQLQDQAVVFDDEATAQALADSIQLGEGDRDEDPSSGGYGIRQGAGCRDPWPTTARDQLEAHPYRGEWAIPVGGIPDDMTYDLETNRRPIDLRHWG